MKRGFTTIELLVVIAILGIIFSFSTGNIIRAVNDARFRSFVDEVSALIKRTYMMTKDEEVIGKYFVRFSGNPDLVVELIKNNDDGKVVIDKAEGRGISLDHSLPLELSFTPDGTIVLDSTKNFVELTFYQAGNPDSDKIIKVDSLPPGNVEVIK